MSRPTPGPWWLEGSDIVADGPIQIAHVFRQVHVDEAAANGAVPAGAPELLTACRDARDLLEYERGRRKLSEDEREILSQLRAAVERAEVPR